MKRRSRGYTLLELGVVILITALIVSLAVPYIVKKRDRLWRVGNRPCFRLKKLIHLPVPGIYRILFESVVLSLDSPQILLRGFYRLGVP